MCMLSSDSMGYEVNRPAGVLRGGEWGELY